MEIHAERWSAHWDEVEDFDDVTPLRPTRRAPLSEFTTLDWTDTVIVGPNLPIGDQHV